MPVTTPKSRITKKRFFTAHAAILAAIALAMAVVITMTAYFWKTRSPAFNMQNLRLTQVTSTGNAAASALSPDRRYVVYALHDGAQESLWVQPAKTSPTQQSQPCLNFHPRLL